VLRSLEWVPAVLRSPVRGPPVLRSPGRRPAGRLPSRALGAGRSRVPWVLLGRPEAPARRREQVAGSPLPQRISVWSSGCRRRPPHEVGRRRPSRRPGAADVWPRVPEDFARCSAEQLASPRAAVRAAAVIATGVILMWVSSVKDACSDADERFEAWRICTPARSMSAPWCGDAMTAPDGPEASCRAGWNRRHTSRGSGDDNEAVYRRRLTCPRAPETPSFGRAARRTAGLRSPSTCSFPPFPQAQCQLLTPGSKGALRN